MATTTTPSSPTIAEPNANAVGSTTTDFLDLADSSAKKGHSQAEINARIEEKRVEHERQRANQRALFEAQMKALEEEQLREEAALLSGNGPTTGAQPVTTPNSPPKGTIGSGIKSMPASRRPSGGSKDDLSFHLGKMSLTAAGTGAAAGTPNSAVGGGRMAKSGTANGTDSFGHKLSERLRFEDEVDGAPAIKIDSNDAFPALVRRDSFPGMFNRSSETQTVPLTGRTPSESRSTTGAAAISPSARSVPGTPQASLTPSIGTNGLRGEPGVEGGAEFITSAPGAMNRGFSNPDLTKAFGYVGSTGGSGFSAGGDGYSFGNDSSDDFGVVDPNVYQSIGLGSSRFSQYGGFGSNGNGFDGKINGLGGVKHKRAEMDAREAEFNRFAGTRIEDLIGELLPLCKDQHGCRYLQKKLEEGVPEHRDMIFRETYGHFADLMTDPFGNYLCQKLLEFSTDEQRNAICESVANDLVSISLNMHGTRAVQKMIDYLSTPRQIRSIIMALSASVVPLIKDLNGNHVIQKCLNRLVPEDNQFIYNAVAAHCVEVATHRHGCCVLQRCIDHAADSQRVQLVTEITYHALTLVQDPFGNYVVQYVLDLNDNRFSDAVTRQFIGNVCALSVQKFSSNVIEKCIRVAEPETRKVLIAELLNRSRLEKLLRDSFANYVVQTALDYAEPGQRMLLVECIRPILPMIRNTPYGKRIQSKLQREHMEQHGHYGGGGFNQQAALLNLAGMSFNGGGGMGMGGGHHQNIGHPRHIGNPSMHHPNALAEAYGQRPPVFGQHNYAPQAIDQFSGGAQQFPNNFASPSLSGLSTASYDPAGFQNPYM